MRQELFEVSKWKGCSRLICCGGNYDIGQPANQAVFADIQKSHTQEQRLKKNHHTSHPFQYFTAQHTSDTKTTICGLVVGVFCCSLQQKVYMFKCV